MSGNQLYENIPPPPTGGGGGGSPTDPLSGDVNGTEGSNHVDSLSGPSGGSVDIHVKAPLDLDYSATGSFPVAGLIKFQDYQSLTTLIAASNATANNAPILTMNGANSSLNFADPNDWNVTYQGNVTTLLGTTEIINESNTILDQSALGHTNLRHNLVNTGGSGSTSVGSDVAWTWTQAAQANNGIPNSLSFAPQAPGLNPVNAQCGTPGGINFQLTQPISGGAWPNLVMSYGGQQVIQLGTSTAFAPTYGVMWMGTAAEAPSNTNWAILGQQGATEINTGAGSVFIQVANQTQEEISTNYIKLTPGPLEWLAQTTAPTLTQLQQIATSAPQSLIISPQAPAAAPSNVVNATPGNLLLNLGAPVATGSQPTVAIQVTGSSVIAFAPQGLVNNPPLSSSFINFADIGNANFANAIIPLISFNRSGTEKPFLGYDRTRWWIGGAGGVDTVIRGSAEVDIECSTTVLWAADAATNPCMMVTQAGSTANATFFSSTGSAGGGQGVLNIFPCGTPPATTPGGGGCLYVVTGSLFWKSANGNVTKLAV